MFNYNYERLNKKSMALACGQGLLLELDHIHMPLNYHYAISFWSNRPKCMAIYLLSICYSFSFSLYYNLMLLAARVEYHHINITLI